MKIAEKIEEICKQTIQQGFMTKDLALMVGPSQKWLTTDQLIQIIKNKVENSTI